MGSVRVWILVLTAAAVAACSSRHGGGAPTPAAAAPYSARPGFVHGLRLRADTPSLTDEQARARSVEATPYGDAGERSYGPAGDAGYDSGSWGGWGTMGDYGYAGPSGAVEPGLRAPSDVPLLHPASPYRGPADPPDVYRRPGTAAGNDFFRHK